MCVCGFYGNNNNLFFHLDFTFCSLAFFLFFFLIHVFSFYQTYHQSHKDVGLDTI